MPTFCSGDWAAGTVLGFCVWTSRCHSIMCTFCVCLGLGVKKHLVKRVGFWFTEQHREHFCTSRKYGSLIMEWKGHWTTCLFFSTFFYSLLSFDRTSGLFLCFRCNHQLKEVCKNGGNKIHSGCRKKKTCCFSFPCGPHVSLSPSLLYCLLSILLPSSPQLRTPTQFQTPTHCIHVNPQSPISPRGLF